MPLRLNRDRLDLRPTVRATLVRWFEFASGNFGDRSKRDAKLFRDRTQGAAAAEQLGDGGDGGAVDHRWSVVEAARARPNSSEEKSALPLESAVRNADRELKRRERTAMARITKALVEKYWSLEAKRKELSRQSADLKKQVDDIEEAFLAHARENGGKARSVVTCGAVLAITEESGSIQWKKEFIAKLGQKAADTLIAAAPKKEVLTVTPAAV